MNRQWLLIGLKFAPLLLSGVRAVEKFVTGLKGKHKEDAAVEFAAEVLGITEGVVGRDLLDDTAVQTATRKFIAAYVELQNVIALKAAKG